MTDERTISIARNWVNFVGVKLAAEAMDVAEDVIRKWVGVSPSATSPSVEKCTEPVEKIDRRQRYTPEQKAEALRLVEEIGLSKASRQTGISVGSLMKWRQEKAEGLQ